MVGVRSDWESRDVPKVARGGLLFQSTADRLEGLEGVEVRLGVVEEVASRRCGLWRGKGLTTLPLVSSPVRDDLISGGGVGVAGVLLRDPAVVLLFRLFS